MPFVAVCEPLGDLADLGVVGAGERQQADLLEAGLADAVLDHRADGLDGPLAHRAGDHAGLAEAAATGAAAEDLDREALVHRLGERHERVGRVGPLVEVHQRVLAHPERDARTVGHHGLDRAVGGVGDVVEARDVDVAGHREAAQQLLATARTVLGLPLAHHVGDREHDLLAVAEHRGVDEVGDRLGVEGGVAAGDHDGVVLGPVGGVQRDAGEVEGVEHVGVAELGGEAQAEQVEGADGTVAVHGELRDRALLVTGAHHLLHVGPHRVGALGEDPVALVEHLVEDLHALVGQAHLVGVGVHQRPPHGGAARLGAGGAVPVLDDRVELAADVLDGLLHRRQLALQAREDRRD